MAVSRIEGGKLTEANTLNKLTDIETKYRPRQMVPHFPVSLDESMDAELNRVAGLGIVAVPWVCVPVGSAASLIPRMGIAESPESNGAN